MNNKKNCYKIGLLVVVILFLSFSFVIFINNYKDTNDSEEDVLKNENMSTAFANGDASFKEVKPISEDDHLWGDIDVPVQIIIYDDFECPFCLKLAPPSAIAVNIFSFFNTSSASSMLSFL